MVFFLVSAGCQTSLPVSENSNNNTSGIINQQTEVNNLEEEIQIQPAEPEKENVVTEAVDEIKNQKIEIMFLGDVMMDSFIADYIRDYGVDYPWTDVSPILNKADIVVANLETSVSTRGLTKKPKGFGFRSAPDTLQGLVNSGIDLVTLANNHVKDYGDDAFFDTLAHLDEYNIKYAGAGKNLEEAEQAVILEHNGLKIGFLSLSSIIPWQGWQADEESPGVAELNPEDYQGLLQNIQEAKNKSDIVIVILHWGTEYKYEPNDWQVELAHKMIDNGADVIIGHHPHILQGIEFYQEKPILYSIGNFVFLKKNDDAGKTGIFRLVLNKDGFIEGSIYPVYIKYTKANLLEKDSSLYNEIIKDLSKYSKELETHVEDNGVFYPDPQNDERLN